MLVAETRYLPYGEERWITGTLVTDFTFTGQRAERGFALMDYNARYYDPWLGRFVSADTVVPEYTNPQDLNRYSYVRGNPLSYTDPSGYCIPGVDCPGMVSGVTDPGEAPPGGEAYAEWLVNFIGWMEQSQAETGGMLDWGLTQQAAAFELSTFLMKDPQVLDELLWQEIGQLGLTTAADLASGTAEFMASGSTGAIIRKIKARLTQDRGITSARNPYGKAGGPAHQSRIEEVVGDLQVMYADNPNIVVVKEYRVPTPYGQKAYRDVDVAAVDVTTGKPVSLHQTGVQKRGLPVNREVQAIDDIEGATGIRPQFHNYNWEGY